jgi:crotonobetainyl-CoA:carnitine CoA-transferase CaiB-like acyl-CoA transferase
LGAWPSDCYPTKGEDQWIAISVQNDSQWAAVCRAIDRPELVHDPRFASVVSRKRNKPVLDQELGAWTSNLDKVDAMEALQKEGVAAGAVFNPRELFQNAHLRQRGFWEAIEDPSAGRQEYYGRPYRMSGIELTTRLPSPKLGEHNRLVLGGLLHMDISEIEELENDGVIGTTPLAARNR